MKFTVTFLMTHILFIKINIVCSKSSIRISNNGYKAIVVGIHEHVKEDQELIFMMKERFAEASQMLYTVTR